MKTLVINSNECIGCNLCVELCPDLFSLGDFAPIPTENDVTYEPCAADSVDFCPVSAIDII